MAHRASMRYTALKLVQGAHEAAAALSSATASLPEAIQRSEIACIVSAGRINDYEPAKCTRDWQLQVAIAAHTRRFRFYCCRGMEAYRKQLTSVMLITGAAMSPTLNPKASR